MTCGACGHYDNCQMMCNLDFDTALEDDQCRHGLMEEEYDDEPDFEDDLFHAEDGQVRRRSDYASRF